MPGDRGDGRAQQVAPRLAHGASRAEQPVARRRDTHPGEREPPRGPAREVRLIGHRPARADLEPHRSALQRASVFRDRIAQSVVGGEAAPAALQRAAARQRHGGVEADQSKLIRAVLGAGADEDGGERAARRRARRCAIRTGPVVSSLQPPSVAGSSERRRAGRPSEAAELPGCRCSSCRACTRNSSTGYGAARRTTSGIAEAGSTTPSAIAAQAAAERVGTGPEIDPGHARGGLDRGQEAGVERADFAPAPLQPGASGNARGATYPSASQTSSPFTILRHRLAPASERGQRREPLRRRQRANPPWSPAAGRSTARPPGAPRRA